MRYRIYFQNDHPPVEVTGYDIKLRTHRSVELVPGGDPEHREAVHTVDVMFACAISSIDDDHGRSVFRA